MKSKDYGIIQIAFKYDIQFDMIYNIKEIGSVRFRAQHFQFYMKSAIEYLETSKIRMPNTSTQLINGYGVV